MTGQVEVPSRFVVARVINRYRDTDYLSGWSDAWGTECSLSEARALSFSTCAAAKAARDRAQNLVPTFIDGRYIEYIVVRTST